MIPVVHLSFVVPLVLFQLLHELPKRLPFHLLTRSIFDAICLDDASAIQALGLDGTPLSPSPGLSAADMGGEADGTAASSHAETTVIQEQRSGLSQGQSKATEDGSSRGDGGHQGAGAERSCGRNKEACDGVVFMVYAKRLS